MQNASNGDGFLALSMLRKVLEGEKALFAQEQYKVLLGAEAALINYALFSCNVNDVRRDEMLRGVEELILLWLALTEEEQCAYLLG